MSKIREILSVKGSHVHTISDSSHALEAVKKMTDLSIGCLVVISDTDVLCGKITERDVLRRIATGVNDLADVTVGEVMTKRVIVCGLDDEIDLVRSIMKNQYVRQMPVVSDDGRLLGIVSLGDVNSYLIQDEETEIKYLHDYIEGRVR